MTQDERRLYLIEKLMAENPRIKARSSPPGGRTSGGCCALL